MMLLINVWQIVVFYIYIFFLILRWMKKLGMVWYHCRTLWLGSAALLSPVGLRVINDQEDLGVAGPPSSVRRLGQRGRRRSRRLFDGIGDGGEKAGTSTSTSTCRLRLAARRAPLPGPWRHCGALLRRIGPLEIRHVAIGKVRDEIAVGEASAKIVHDGNRAELTDLRISSVWMRLNSSMFSKIEWLGYFFFHLQWCPKRNNPSIINQERSFKILISNTRERTI